MKVLITGGTGFYGRHLVWRATAEGADVVFTGRDAHAAQKVLLAAQAPVQWLQLSHGEMGAGSQLAAAAAGADAIIHCAALSSPWGRYDDFWRANVASAAEVIAACHANGIRRLVHVSTPSLYFNFSDRLNLHESATLPLPVNDYARTKREAEQLVERSGLPEVVILRPRALFGPWDQTLVPRLLRLIRKGPVPLMRGGQQQIDLTYIDNAVDAAWRALTWPLPRALNLYNVTNDEPRALISVLQVMTREFGLPLRTKAVPWPLVRGLAHGLELHARWISGKEPVFTRYSAGVLGFSQTLNVSALRDELGWRANVGIDEGIRQHAQWWRAQHT